MYTTPMKSPDSPRILITRLSTIGDSLLTIPILNALRDHFPNAWIGWVIEDRCAGILRGHCALDELIVVPRGWLKSPATVWGLRRRLRNLAPEIAIDPQGLSKSCIVAWISGAKRRIGFSGEWGRELSPWLNNELVLPQSRHMIDQGLELLRPLGINNPRVHFDIHEDQSDAEAAERMIGEMGLEGGFAVVNPAAGWPSRLWPLERFAAIAEHLGRKWNLPTMVAWAGDREHAMAERVAAGSGGYARLPPATRLLEFGAITRRARLFVSSDTGPLYLAAAFGTPCVGLFGPTLAERTRPYGPQHIAIQKRSIGSRAPGRRTASPALMEAISVDDVCEACDQILDRGRQSN